MPWSLTRAAATGSWVESGLLAQRVSSAPPALRARARLAVSVVTWRHPDMRMPWSGFSAANLSRTWARRGISRAAQSISCWPWSASPRSATSCATALIFTLTAGSLPARKGHHGADGFEALLDVGGPHRLQAVGPEALHVEGR